MLNIHLNGDIVRCPDIAAIRARLSERNDFERRCKYGKTEIYCEAWQKYISEQSEVKNFTDFGRCKLGYCANCPEMRQRKNAGNVKKNYEINNVVYRKMASSANYIIKTSPHTSLFINLTFPPYLKTHKYTKSFYYEQIANIKFSQFIENLRRHHGLLYYIAVRERGEDRGRLHFHCILSMPYTDFRSLNTYWCNVISDICEYSPNAVTHKKENYIIKNFGRALRYVCKYFAKSKGAKSESRILFMSRNLINKPLKCQSDIESILSGYKGVYIRQTSDYTTCFRVTNSNDFDRFLKNFVYPYFELPVLKSKNLIRSG